MALEQHAVPSQVTAYEFRLIGDMTLKQFAWLASGGIVAILAYSLPLPGYIRWPLVFLFAPMGAVVAFIPYEGRGIDRWVVAFIKAVYSPTEFIWRQEKPIPDFFFKGKSEALPTGTPAKVTPSDQSKLEEYIHSLPQVVEHSQIEDLERQQISQINQLFDNDNSNSSVSENQVDRTGTFSAVPIVQTANLPVDKISDEAMFAGGVLTEHIEGENIETTAESKKAIPTIPEIQTAVVDTTAQTPAADQSKVQNQPAETLQSENIVDQVKQQKDQQLYQHMAKTNTLDQPITEDHSHVGVPAVFSDNLPLSSIPNQPNIIVGMVTDAQGKIVENAIIEVKDMQNKPVRALKSNQLGQFAIATPLKDGQYTLEVEKPGLVFDRFYFKTQGRVLSPMSVQAKN